MPVTGSDITRNADAFRRAYPSWPKPEPAESGTWEEDPFWRCAVHDIPLAYDQAASDANDQDRWSCPDPDCTQGRWV